MTRRRPTPSASISQPRPLTRRALLGWGGTAALLSACGGGGGGDDGGAGSSGEPGGPVIPAEQRAEALQAVAGEFDRLRNGGLSAPAEALADFMRSRPEYRRVTVMADGCVCGEFTDGQLHVVGNNLRPGRATGATALAPRADAPVQARPRPAHPAATRDAEPQSHGGRMLAGIPTSSAAISASCFVNYAHPDGDPGDIHLFNDMLERAGLDVVTHWVPTVEHLREMPELGFFSWLTHGGMLQAGGAISHALMTRTPADVENIVAHLLDLQAGNLVYYTGQYLYSRGAWSAENFLAITPAFIERYRWRFSPDSIVLIHACASDFEGFKQAFRAAGAGVYGGWSHPVWVHAATYAMQWMLDKFIASNQAVPTPDPRNRAHDYAAIKHVGDEAELFRYDDPEEGGTVEFRFTRLNGEPAGLMPSMVRMQVEEPAQRLVLHGSFGSTQGRVFVGTTLATDEAGLDNYLPWRPAGTLTELTVVQWRRNEVTVELPRSGAGSAGYVAVQVGRRWSNARALTRWSGEVLVESGGPGTLRLRHSARYSLRCDIGLWRYEPDGQLQDVLMSATATPHESTWSWIAAGQHSHTEPGPVTTTVEWSGGDHYEVPATPRGPFDPQYYSVFAFIDRTQRQFRISISGGWLAAMPATEVIVTPNSSTRLDHMFNIGLPLALAPTPGSPTEVGVLHTLGDDFSLSAGTLTSVEPTLLPLADPNVQTLTHTITWGEMSAEYPPHRSGGA